MDRQSFSFLSFNDFSIVLKLEAELMLLGYVVWSKTRRTMMRFWSDAMGTGTL